MWPQKWGRFLCDGDQGDLCGTGRPLGKLSAGSRLTAGRSPVLPAAGIVDLFFVHTRRYHVAIFNISGSDCTNAASVYEMPSFALLLFSDTLPTL
jgi:hypothetical protein